MKKICMLAGLLFTSVCLLAQTKAGKIDTTKHTTFYTCSMHPDVTGHEPGKCPRCGMELSLTAKERMKKEQVKTYACPAHLDVVKHDPGQCPKCGKKLHLSAKEQMKAEVVKLYTCPMHPEVALDKEGKCPKCGEALKEKKNNR